MHLGTTQLTAPKIQDIDWDILTDTIREERCVVFIGPEVFADAGGVRLESQLLQHLKTSASAYVQDFYPEDGLMLFQRGKKTAAGMKIKDFYNRPPGPETAQILQLVAQTPFHFVVSLTPDSHVKNAFAQHRGAEPDFDFYWKKNPARSVDRAPTAAEPLVYNLLGHTKEVESMILTHNDLYEYFESIFQEKSMPVKYKDALRNAHNFIFLGVDFRKWYMHILLRILRIHTDQDELMRFAANQGIDDDLKSFCYNQFQIEFVPYNNIRDFLSELKDQYFRKFPAGSPGVSTLGRVRELALHGKLEDAFDAFDGFLSRMGEPAKDLAQAVGVLSGSYYKMKRDADVGRLYHQDVKTQTAAILDGFLAFLDQAKPLEI